MAYNITDTAPRVRYLAAQDQTNFIVPFEFPLNSHIVAYRNQTLLTYNSNPANANEYSLVGASVNGGGTLTLGGTGANLDDDILITRDIPVQRLTDFPSSGVFNIEALNDELDWIVAMIQRNEHLITQRMLRFEDWDSPEIIQALPKAADRANGALVFDEYGQPAVSKELGDSIDRAELAAQRAEIAADAAEASEAAAENAKNQCLLSEVAAVAAQQGAEAAETSAIAAKNSAQASATAASEDANDADQARIAAEAARDATVPLYDDFSDKYLGAKAVPPTLDNNGNPLQTGALYFDTSLGQMRAYTGSGWTAAYSTSLGINDTATQNVLYIKDIAIGINNSAPDGKLHIVGTNGKTGQTAAPHSNGLIIDENGSTGISILTDNASVGYLTFGDKEDADRADFRYRHASDEFAFFIAGNQVASISQSGKIYSTGANPGMYLDSGGTDTTTDIFRSAGAFYMDNRNGSGAGSFVWRQWNGSSNAEQMRLNSNGNLGIGESTPIARLHVRDSTPNMIMQDDAGGNINHYYQQFYVAGEMRYECRYGANAGGYAWFTNAGGTPSRRMTLTGDGDLGIGEANPDQKVEINGNVRVVSDIFGAASGVTPNHVGTNSSTEGFLWDKSINRLSISSDRTSGIVIINDYLRTTNADLMRFYTAGRWDGHIRHDGAGVVSYSGFLGTHYAENIDPTNPELLRGTIVESVDELVDQNMYIGSRLPKIKVSDTPNSPAVYGTIIGRERDENEDPVSWAVMGAGAGFIRLNAAEAVPNVGDAIVSNGDGTGVILDPSTPMTVGVHASIVAHITAGVPVDAHPDGSIVYPCTLRKG